MPVSSHQRLTSVRAETQTHLDTYPLSQRHDMRSFGNLISYLSREDGGQQPYMYCQAVCYYSFKVSGFLQSCSSTMGEAPWCKFPVPLGRSFKREHHHSGSYYPCVHGCTTPWASVLPGGEDLPHARENTALLKEVDMKIGGLRTTLGKKRYRERWFFVRREYLIPTLLLTISRTRHWRKSFCQQLPERSWLAIMHYARLQHMPLLSVSSLVSRDQGCDQYEGQRIQDW